MADKIGAVIVTVLYDVDVIKKELAHSGTDFDTYLRNSGMMNGQQVYAAYIRGDII